MTAKIDSDVNTGTDARNNVTVFVLGKIVFIVLLFLSIDKIFASQCSSVYSGDTWC